MAQVQQDAARTNQCTVVEVVRMYEMNIMVFILSQMGHLAGVPFQDTKGPYIDEPACEARKVEFMAVTDEVKKKSSLGRKYSICLR